MGGKNAIPSVGRKRIFAENGATTFLKILPDSCKGIFLEKGCDLIY